MWSKPGALMQYYPLTGTTFWLDHQLWGSWTLPYHLENVLLHACGALLFWRLLVRLQVPGAWLAGATFALHPIMVESVAWIAERKNVLSLVAYLGALLAYGRFAGYWLDNSPAAGGAERCPPRRWGAYAVSVLLLVAALLAKTTAFSFPAVILLLCWWKRGRIRWRSDVVPALPLFALAIGFGLTTVWVEKYTVGATGSEWAFSFPQRCLIAGQALWFYAAKLLWPANLCFVYPRWQLDAVSLGQWLYPISAVGVVLVLWLARAKIGRGPAAAAFFFVGNLLPVLGFMNVFYMRYSFVCDHWAYVSSLGLITAVAVLVVRGAGRLQAPAALYGFAAIVLPVLGVMTWRQCGMYASEETLWRTTVERNSGSFIARNNLANLLFARGQVNEAIVHYRRALELQPDGEAVAYNLGQALFAKGQVDEAIAYYRQAMDLKPDGAVIAYDLGNALFSKGQVDEAIACYRRALDIQPDGPAIACSLGNALLAKSRVDEAIACYHKALELSPTLARAHNGLANALVRKGQLNEAIAQFEAALRLDPNQVATLANLAWVFAASADPSARNGSRAVELAQQADRLSQGRSPEVLRTLAAAYAEAGRFPEAMATAGRALELPAIKANAAATEAFQAQMKLYAARTPFRDPSLTNSNRGANLP